MPEDKRKAMATQLMVTAFMENSVAMSGRATFIAADNRGFTNEVNTTA